MLYINKITNDPLQQLILNGIPNLQITLQLQYYPRSQRWAMNINDGVFQANGIAVVCGLNLLRQWKNIISYGITCIRPDGLDPYQLDDFQNQVANLYLLDSADVAQIEQQWFT
jgi:hypothetical protein